MRSELSFSNQHSTVTQEALVTLLTQTLQQLAAMVWKLHSSFITFPGRGAGAVREERGAVRVRARRGGREAGGRAEGRRSARFANYTASWRVSCSDFTAMEMLPPAVRRRAAAGLCGRMCAVRGAPRARRGAGGAAEQVVRRPLSRYFPSEPRV